MEGWRISRLIRQSIDFHPLFSLVGVRGEVGWSHVALQAPGVSYWMSRYCGPCLGPLCQGQATFFYAAQKYACERGMQPLQIPMVLGSEP
jgi:hypothetical protein